jgi:hypothetical protein
VPKPSAAPPDPSIPTDFAEHARIMMDLMTLAFQTDSTRVVTLLLALEQSPRAYPEIGIPEAHHGLTHHQGDQDKIAKVTEINCFQMRQFAYLLGKLKSTPEGDGTLLDHCCLLYAHEHAEANPHKNNGLGMIIAGHAKHLATGTHTETTATAGDVYVTLADEIIKAGIGTFPTYSRKVTELLA